MSPEQTTERSLGDTPKSALTTREVPSFVQNPLHLLKKISQETVRKIGSNRFGRQFLLGGLAATAAVGGFAAMRASADSPTPDQVFANISNPANALEVGGADYQPSTGILNYMARINSQYPYQLMESRFSGGVFTSETVLVESTMDKVNALKRIGDLTCWTGHDNGVAALECKSPSEDITTYALQAPYRSEGDNMEVLPETNELFVSIRKYGSPSGVAILDPNTDALMLGTIGGSEMNLGPVVLGSTNIIQNKIDTYSVVQTRVEGQPKTKIINSEVDKLTGLSTIKSSFISPDTIDSPITPFRDSNGDTTSLLKLSNYSFNVQELEPTTYITTYTENFGNWEVQNGTWLGNANKKEDWNILVGSKDVRVQDGLSSTTAMVILQNRITRGRTSFTIADLVSNSYKNNPSGISKRPESFAIGDKRYIFAAVEGIGLVVLQQGLDGGPLESPYAVTIGKKVNQEPPVTSTPTSTETPAPTDTPQPTETPSPSTTPIPPTATFTTTATFTPTPTGTATFTSTSTATAEITQIVPTSTATHLSTLTSTPINTPLPTGTATSVVSTSTPTPRNTGIAAQSTETSVPDNTATNTPVVTVTSTATAQNEINWVAIPLIAKGAAR